MNPYPVPALVFAGLSLIAGCAALPAAPGSGGNWLVVVDGVGALGTEARHRELAELSAARTLNPRERLRLAALLEREDSAEALERALKVLATLDDTDARPLAELLKRLVRARLDLRQQSVRVQSLEAKLEQIKALEKSLQLRSEPARAP